MGTHDSVWKGVTGGMTAWMDNAPTWVVDVFDRASKWAGIQWSRDSQQPMAEDKRRAYPDLRGAEAIGSCVLRGRPDEDDGLGTVVPGHESQHVIMLDIDHPAILIPSSTPGHHHLIVNKVLGWSDYRDLLDTMGEVGLIEPGFRDASVERGETFLRPPWIRKGCEAHDASEALMEWLDADDRPKELRDPEALEDWLTSP